MLASAHARDIPTAPHHIAVAAAPAETQTLLGHRLSNGGKSTPSPALINLLTPLKRAISRSSDSSSDRSSSGSSATPATWANSGYENLPDSKDLKLVALQKRRQSSGDSGYSILSGLSDDSKTSGDSIEHAYQNHISSNGRPKREHSLGRIIPQNVGFTLEWSGQIPIDTRSFELKEIAPALIQHGRYYLTILWSSKHCADFVNMAAIKAMEVRVKGRSIAKVADDNEISFRKDQGPAVITLTKESWLHRAKEPERRLMWRLRYEPLPETVSYFSSDSDSDESRSSSRSNSEDSNKSIGRRRSSFSAVDHHVNLPHITHPHGHHIQAGILSTSPEDIYKSPLHSPLVMSSPIRPHAAFGASSRAL